MALIKCMTISRNQKLLPKSSAHFFAGVSAVSANSDTRAFYQLETLAIDAEGHGFQVCILDSYQGSHGVTAAGHNHGAIGDLGRVLGQCSCRVRFFNDFHKSNEPLIIDYIESLFSPFSS